MQKFITLCFICMICTLNATEKIEIKNGEISGTILDAVLNQPLPYVNIIIKNSEDTTVTGGITSEDGTFKINKIPEGKFKVIIQYIGYKSKIRNVSITTNSYKIDLGIIKLEESAEGLDEITIVAETSSVVQKIDRKVINVGKDLISAGTTASELLNNVQSVSVDSQTGNLSLRGNENVRVLIDGKPSNISVAQLLKQIPSSSIKQVELITNPSAKYNPEGMSGIINIILHKNANQGFNGNVNAGVTHGENTRFNGAVGMNYKTGKVNFYTNYGHGGGDNEFYGFVNRSDNNSEQKFDNLMDNTNHFLKFGTDFYINDKNTISVYTVQNKFDGRNDQSINIFDNNILTINNDNININDNKNQTYNFHYKLELDKKDHDIEFESNFSKFKGTENASSSESIDPDDKFLNYTNDIRNIRKNTLLNLDYTNPLSENSKLELGLEYRFNQSENSSITDQLEALPNNMSQDTPDLGFSYDRHIYSAYVNYNHKIGKVSMQLGTRFEQYDIAGSFIKGAQIENITDDIFSLYPSAFFTYNPSEKNQFQVSYSRRVDRPSLGQLNPIRQWSTPRVTNVGNPDLNPQFTNSFEFNYTHQVKNGSYTFGTFYRRVNDNISRILNIDPLDENKVLLTFSNYDASNRYGFEGSFNYKFTKWWDTNASADIYVQEQTGIANGDQLEVTNTAFNARINNNFTATKNLRFQLFYMFQGGGKSLQFEKRSMSQLNIGTSLNILKDKGTISFRVNDIFQGMRFKFKTDRPYPANGQFNWESRTAYLGFNYRFGGGKNQALKRKQRDKNEAGGGGGFL
jgi:outer membrane receptor protein involved in Fe transport